MTSTVDWVRYRIYCNDEADWRYWTLNDGDPLPTTCPVDSAHSVNPSSVNEVERRAISLVNINEEQGPQRTGGHFQVTSHRVDASANSVTTYDINEPIPYAGYAIHFRTTADHEGDVVNMYVAPDTVVGTITSDVVASDTVLNVGTTVVTAVKVGYLISITDGVNVDQLGRVISIDQNALTITVETAATQAFAAATPTYVRMSVQMVRDFEIGPAGSYSVGDAKIGGSYLAANTTLRITYWNKHATMDKSLVAYTDQTY